MKVLIVDDNPVNQTLMSRLVERDCGAATVCAGDGPSGLAAFSANDPDVVVVDYMMPGMDGVEFIGRVRTDPGSLDVPILMVTADGDRQLRHRALRGGATDFLTKPVDPEEFGARVGNMLRLSDAQRALRRQNETLAEKVERATAGIIRAERETLWCLARVAECRDRKPAATSSGWRPPRS
ncbi:MAG: response regulator [Burkholderiaceae bacterium]